MRIILLTLIATQIVSAADDIVMKVKAPNWHSKMTTEQLIPICDAEKDPKRKAQVCGMTVSRYSVMLPSQLPASAPAQANELLNLYKSNPQNDLFIFGLHESHQTLGLSALKNGNQRMAVEELLRSIQVPKTPALQTLGPKMVLANELLQKGEKKRVLEFLDGAEKMWNGPEAMEKLKKWRSEISTGKNLTL